MPKLLKNIYLADDDSDDVDFFHYALAEISPECRLNVSYDGEELIQNLEKGQMPDIIFIDLNMPRLSGIETLKRIKSMGNYSHIPIIIYSTSSSLGNILLARDMGASRYFVKPPNFNNLKDRIRSFLRCDWKNYIIPENLENFTVHA